MATRRYAPFVRITPVGVKPKQFKRLMINPTQPYPGLPLPQARVRYQDLLLAGSFGLPGGATDLRPVKN
jgi:hypothetical protein